MKHNRDSETFEGLNRVCQSSPGGQAGSEPIVAVVVFFN